MAAKGKRESGNAGFGGYKFINVRLDSADKKRISAIDCATTFPLEALSDLVQEGYKVSFSEDPKNHSSICSLTDMRDDSPFYKHILTGRGSSSINAWYALCYKHLHLAKGSWTALADAADSGGSDFG